MSVIGLDVAKQFLDVIHSGDDAKIQRLLNSAESDAVLYMNRGLLGPKKKWSFVDCVLVSTDVPDTITAEIDPSIELGVLLLVQAEYEASPDDAVKIRRAAEIKLAPHRCGLGV